MLMMSNQKDKTKNEGEDESESGEGLVDLSLDEEADEHKIFEIVKEEEEEKCVQNFFKSTNKIILEKVCDTLALLFSNSIDVIDQAKKELTDIQ